MTTPDADLRAMRKDILLLLAFPAVIVGTIGYATWPWTTPPYAAASQEAFFETVAGVWDWASDSSCTSNPQVISFSPSRDLMYIAMREKWENSAGDSTRVSVYDLTERSPSHVRGAIRGEQRTTDDSVAVAWDLVLQGADRFAWHRTDWDEGSTTASLTRCPAGTEALVPPLTEAERSGPALEGS
jgi:hypothetical protein